LFSKVAIRFVKGGVTTKRPGVTKAGGNSQQVFTEKQRAGGNRSAKIGRTKKTARGEGGEVG